MMGAAMLWLLLAIDPFGGAAKKAVVLVFTRVDCPISNRYAPEVKRIYERYSSRGVAFYLVYPDKDLSAAAMEQHRRDYGYPMSGIADPAHELVRKAEAHTTPEAAVFVGGKLVYRGRIDDRYVDFGQSRPAATKHDLDEVLAAVIAGKPVPFHETKAIGCAIDDLR